MSKVTQRIAYIVVDEFGPTMVKCIVTPNRADALRIFHEHNTFDNEFRLDEYKDGDKKHEEYSLIPIWVMEEIQEENNDNN